LGQKVSRRLPLFVSIVCVTRSSFRLSGRFLMTQFT